MAKNCLVWDYLVYLIKTDKLSPQLFEAYNKNVSGFEIYTDNKARSIAIDLINTYGSTDEYNTLFIQKEERSIGFLPR